jgi:hypothetical protein
VRGRPPVKRRPPFRPPAGRYPARNRKTSCRADRRGAHHRAADQEQQIKTVARDSGLGGARWRSGWANTRTGWGCGLWRWHEAASCPCLQHASLISAIAGRNPLRGAIRAPARHGLVAATSATHSSSATSLAIRQAHGTRVPSAALRSRHAIKRALRDESRTGPPEDGESTPASGTPAPGRSHPRASSRARPMQ